MSDQPPAPRKPPEEDDVSELPGESAPGGADPGGLTLEEQIAQLPDIEMEEEGAEHPPADSRRHS